MPASKRIGAEQEKSPGIFISYRRSDNPDATGRIYDRLVSEFGKARVFKDVDSIPLGQDFRGHLNDIVGGCAAVLAIIGPRWTDARNSSGQRRLEDADDFVRIELEAALARDIPVVPVLVAHAPMPGTAELPASLASMAFRQSIEVRPDPDFHNDATRLVLALRKILNPNSPDVEPARVTRKPDSPTRWIAGFAVATLAAAALAIPALKYIRETLPQESRIAIPLLAWEGNLTFALSPDGRQLVYVAKGDAEARLWLRSLSTTVAQPLPGTGGGAAPFWSPDGRSIGFFAAGALKRLDIGGGQPQTLATTGSSSTGAWGKGGDILFNPAGSGALARISATGGEVTVVTGNFAKDVGQRVHSVLPDGKHFLFAVIGGKEPGTYLGSLGGSAPIRLTKAVGPGAYLPSGWNLMLLLDPGANATMGKLVAQRLDLRNSRMSGEPITIANDVFGVSASSTGLIAALSAGVNPGQRRLTWVDRYGKELGTIGDADGTLDSPRVAPDGRRVVVSRISQGNRDIWLLDGARTSRITFDAADDAYPIWSPDGKRIAFMSSRSGTRGLYVKPASGAGGEEMLQSSAWDSYPSGWTADGRYLLYFSVTPRNDTDIGLVSVAGDHNSIALLTSHFPELWGQISPDGRWLAYQSNESGQYEVFVRPLQLHDAVGKPASDTAAVQWMVSTDGGVHPVWSPKGKELYFLNRAGEMQAASIDVKDSALVPGKPIKLFDARIWGGGVDNATGRQYDVASDGRFLINRELSEGAPATMTLIQNWNPDAGK